jgi:hypothetical protein
VKTIVPILLILNKVTVTLELAFVQLDIPVTIVLKLLAAMIVELPTDEDLATTEFAFVEQTGLETIALKDDALLVVLPMENVTFLKITLVLAISDGKEVVATFPEF